MRVSPPAILAPMAGVTNYPFRAICRRFGAGLVISEMIPESIASEERRLNSGMAGIFGFLLMMVIQNVFV